MDLVARSLGLARVLDHQHLPKVVAGVALDQDVVGELALWVDREGLKAVDVRVAVLLDVQVVVHVVVADRVTGSKEAHGVRIPANVRAGIGVCVEAVGKLVALDDPVATYNADPSSLHPVEIIDMARTAARISRFLTLRRSRWEAVVTSSSASASEPSS